MTETISLTSWNDYRDWLRAAYSLYLHDLSKYGADYELSPAGVWQPDYLPYWLEHDFCVPLIIRSGDLPVGFAFVGRHPFPFMSEDVEFHLAEFFILAAHRRAGVGERAARAVFERFNGAFELMVLPRNTPALAFWRRVTSSFGAIEGREGEAIHFAFSTGAGRQARPA
jgi:aminoglycoside 6'-N-acetyltransferase I